MKKFIFVLAPFLALNSFAGTLFTQTVTNGTVAPAFQHSTVCTVNADEVLINSYGVAIDFPFTQHRQIRFNDQVPNADVALSLIMEASHYTNVKQAPLVGGGVTTDLALVPGKTPAPLTLLVATGTRYVESNPSEAAKKLVEFINLNCK